ncbi:MAG: GDP-mannose dehydrogenase, partial [Limnobacter sp.]|nr:GDP-mannose dehydrogenase [Limnobacter sp.]
AEALIGKGVKLSVFDPDVSLSRLLGANKRFIEKHLPHIGELVGDDLSATVADAELVVIGTSNRMVLDELARVLQPSQKLLDLVNVRASTLADKAQGLCW